VAIAKIVDRDLKDSAVGNALFFHARYVSPGWRLKRVASIGNHVFYR
jgi:spore germination cell wall hydrolase CwlJ-like protein